MTIPAPASGIPAIMNPRRPAGAFFQVLRLLAGWSLVLAGGPLGASPYPPKPWENLPEPPLWIEAAEAAGGGFNLSTPAPILLWGVPMEKAEMREVLDHLQTLAKPMPRAWSQPNPTPAIAIMLEKMGEVGPAIDVLGRASADDVFSHATRLRLALAAGRTEEAREAARATIRAMVTAADAFKLDGFPPPLRLAALPFGTGPDQSARAAWIRSLREAADSPLARLLVAREELDLLFHERGANGLRELVAGNKLDAATSLLAIYFLDGLPAMEAALAHEKYQHLSLEEFQALQAAGIHRSPVLLARMLARVREGKPTPEARRRLFRQAGITADAGAIVIALAQSDPQGLEDEGAALIGTVMYLSMARLSSHEPEAWPIDVAPFVENKDRPTLRLAGIIRQDPLGSDPAHSPALVEIISAMMRRVAEGRCDWKFTLPPQGVIIPGSIHPLEVAVSQLALRLPAADLRGVLADAPEFARLPAPWRLRLLARAALPRLFLEEMERVDWSDPAMDEVLPPASIGLATGVEIQSPYRADFPRYRALLPARIAGSPQKKIPDIVRAFSSAEQSCRWPDPEMGRADELLPEVLRIILPRHPGAAEAWEQAFRDLRAKPAHDTPAAHPSESLGLDAA
jgi:hypothetical protein